MNTDIEIVSTELLRPSSPTPDHQKRIKRSILDQVRTPIYVPVNLFYTNDAERSLKIPETLLHLKKSLSETMTRFYPFAGRIKDQAYVDCNDEGVIYTEAKVRCQMSEFLEKPDIDLLCKFLPCKPWTVTSQLPSSLPLFGVQVNVFECGGIVIGSCFSHKIADATTMSVFLNSWAKVARGCTEEMMSSLPDFTLAPSLFPPMEQLPDEMSLPFSLQGGKFLTRRFLFNTESLERLKAEVATHTNPNPSRVQCLTAFVWERYMSRFCIQTGKVSGMIHVVNLRPRFNPPLPSCSVGNLLGTAVALYDPQRISKEGLQEGKLLQELAKEVKNAIQSVDIGSLQSEQAVIEIIKTLGKVADNDVKNGVGWSSWCRIEFYEVDFGWGKPVWVGITGQVEEPNVLKRALAFLCDSGPADTDSGIEVWMTLPEEKMVILENDQKFLKFASANPSILRR